MFWKIYFVLFVVFIVASYGLAVFFDDLEVIHYIDFIVSVPSLVGLYGLAFSKRFLAAKFWQIYFFIYLLWDFVFDLLALPLILHTSYNLSSLFGFVILIPLLIALYIYAFKFSANNGKVREKWNQHD